MSTPFRFATDTATLVMFDLASLRHRLDDDAPDWWVFPASVQVEAINSGAAAFIDLGADGVYSGTLRDTAVPAAALSFTLNCPSGKFFLGAGEETTSDGMEPDCTRGGLMLSLEPGVLHVTVARMTNGELHVGFVRIEAPARNAFAEPLSLRGSAG